MKIYSKLIVAFCAVLVIPLTFGLVGEARPQSDTEARSRSDSRHRSRSSQRVDVQAQVSEHRQQMERRLKIRKERRQINLTSADESRLSRRCAASQRIISQLHNRLDGVSSNRQRVYDNLVYRLTTLSERLDQQSIPTAELDIQIAELKGLVKAFTKSFDDYHLAITDLVEMDCANDPAAFAAALDEARALRQETISSSSQISDYAKNSISSTLREVRLSLGADHESDVNSSPEPAADPNQPVDNQSGNQTSPSEDDIDSTADETEPED